MRWRRWDPTVWPDKVLDHAARELGFATGQCWICNHARPVSVLMWYSPLARSGIAVCGSEECAAGALEMATVMLASIAEGD